MPFTGGVGAALQAGGFKSFLVGVGANLIIGGALQLLQKNPQKQTQRKGIKESLHQWRQEYDKRGDTDPIDLWSSKGLPHILSFQYRLNRLQPSQ